MKNLCGAIEGPDLLETTSGRLDNASVGHAAECGHHTTLMLRLARSAVRRLASKRAGRRAADASQHVPRTVPARRAHTRPPLAGTRGKSPSLSSSSSFSLEDEKVLRSDLLEYYSLLSSDVMASMKRGTPTIGNMSNAKAQLCREMARDYLAERERDLPIAAMRHYMRGGRKGKRERHHAIAMWALTYPDYAEWWSREMGLGDERVPRTEKPKPVEPIGPDARNSFGAVRKLAKKGSMKVANALRQDPRLSVFTDLTSPERWYPLARALGHRRIIIHQGPTNSGKTYHAIKALASAESGIYCGPLRLLAWEIFEKLNAQGVPCDLLTGQEMQSVQGSRHVSCTVEMTPTDKRFDVCVIDEMQLLVDSSRGWAWTQALLGVAAREIHVCGDPSMAEIVTKIAQSCGDSVEIRTYERKSKLELSKKPLVGYKNLRRGDVVVAFSRKKILQTKREIEKSTSMKCCAVYGMLPPETRKSQTNLFNARDSGYDVLVASDAIGMGLNLNIGRVLFSQLSKYDGVEQRTLKTTEVLQIGGRAGRFGTEFSTGYVGTIGDAAKTDGVLRSAWKKGLPTIQRATLMPPVEAIRGVTDAHAHASFTDIMTLFETQSSLEGLYKIADLSDMKEIAVQIAPYGLPLEEQILFCMAPVRRSKSSLETDAIDAMASGIAGGSVSVYEKNVLDESMWAVPPKDDDDLEKLESVHSIMDVYLWLSQHLGAQIFVDAEKMSEDRKQVAEMIDRGLRRPARREKRKK